MLKSFQYFILNSNCQKIVILEAKCILKVGVQKLSRAIHKYVIALKQEGLRWW